jgi:ubiquinone/menaquinone biosynthesis C-methylase UbiE
LIGLNLDKYDNKLVKSLTLVDISSGMITQAKARVKELSNLKNIPISFHIIDVTSNELVSMFGEESFDTVIDTFSLCVMGNIGAQQCMNQLSKVVKKHKNNGQLLLLENTKSSNTLLGYYQDLTANAAASTGGKGCVYNQNVEQIILSSKQLQIIQQISYATGLFRFFKCIRL